MTPGGKILWGHLVVGADLAKDYISSLSSSELFQLGVLEGFSPRDPVTATGNFIKWWQVAANNMTTRDTLAIPETLIPLQTSNRSASFSRISVAINDQNWQKGIAKHYGPKMFRSSSSKVKPKKLRASDDDGMLYEENLSLFYDKLGKEPVSPTENPIAVFVSTNFGTRPLHLLPSSSSHVSSFGLTPISGKSLVESGQQYNSIYLTSPILVGSSMVVGFPVSNDIIRIRSKDIQGKHSVNLVDYYDVYVDSLFGDAGRLAKLKFAKFKGKDAYMKELEIQAEKAKNKGDDATAKKLLAKLSKLQTESSMDSCVTQSGEPIDGLFDKAKAVVAFAKGGKTGYNSEKRKQAEKKLAAAENRKAKDEVDLQILEQKAKEQRAAIDKAKAVVEKRTLELRRRDLSEKGKKKPTDANKTNTASNIGGSHEKGWRPSKKRTKTNYYSHSDEENIGCEVPPEDKPAVSSSEEDGEDESEDKDVNSKISNHLDDASNSTESSGDHDDDDSSDCSSSDDGDNTNVDMLSHKQWKAREMEFERKETEAAIAQLEKDRREAQKEVDEDREELATIEDDNDRLSRECSTGIGGNIVHKVNPKSKKVLNTSPNKEGSNPFPKSKKGSQTGFGEKLVGSLALQIGADVNSTIRPKVSDLKDRIVPPSFNAPPATAVSPLISTISLKDPVFQQQPPLVKPVATQNKPSVSTISLKDPIQQQQSPPTANANVSQKPKGTVIGANAQQVEPTKKRPVMEIVIHGAKSPQLEREISLHGKSFKTAMGITRSDPNQFRVLFLEPDVETKVGKPISVHELETGIRDPNQNNRTIGLNLKGGPYVDLETYQMRDKTRNHPVSRAKILSAFRLTETPRDVYIVLDSMF